MDLIIQLIGFAGMIVIILCFYCRRHRHVLLLKLIADVLWMLHYFLLGAFSGAATNLVCCMRESVYMLEKNEKRRYVWLVLFILLNWTGAFLTWKGIWNILPATVSTFGAYSFWQKNVKVTRKIGILNGVLMFIYDIFARSYIGMASETLTIISASSALIYFAKHGDVQTGASLDETQNKRS